MITLTIDGHHLLFDKDFELPDKKIKVLKIRNVFYARFGGTFAHRLIINAQKGEIVDHINGNGLDNRRSNLRIVSYQANRLNRVNGKSKKTSKYFGVSIDQHRNKKRIRVLMKIDGKVKNFYGFKTEEDAASFYDSKAAELYKDKALLNFPLA